VSTPLFAIAARTLDVLIVAVMFVALL